MALSKSEWQMQCPDLWQGGMRKEFRLRQRFGCTSWLMMVKKDWRFEVTSRSSPPNAPESNE